MDFAVVDQGDEKASALGIARYELDHWKAWRGRVDHEVLVARYWPGKQYRNWCAAFVAHCLRSAGLKAPDSGRALRGALALTRFVAEHGTWRVGTRRVREWLAHELEGGIDVPRAGDVIAWKRSRLVPWMGHVALVESYASRTGIMVVLEGNINGRVCRTAMGRREWTKRFAGLYGIARPG